MTIFIIGLIIFFAIHHIRQVAPGVRDSAIERFGLQGYKGIYSLIALLGLALIIAGWIMGRPDTADLYIAPDWGRHVTSLIVLFAFIFIISANMPTGRIKSTLQHPMSIGIILWSAGHLLANGDLMSVLLFGLFILSSVWHIFAANGRGDPKPQFAGYQGDFGAIGIGVIAYAVFAFWLHGPLIGVAPF